MRTLRPTTKLAVLAASLGFSAMAASPAFAIPSFADQTGQPCSACHVGSFGPALTPTGREFKLEGYTWDGGDSKLPHVSAMLQTYLTHTKKGQPGGAARKRPV